MANATEAGRNTPCAAISVLVLGNGKIRPSLITALQRSGHPLVDTTGDAVEPKVVIVLCDKSEDCCVLTDDVHTRWPAARVIVASQHMCAELEEEIALRSFAVLRLQSTNEDEFHALVHDALIPTPPPIPRALKPRKTDHPPSSRH